MMRIELAAVLITLVLLTGCHKPESSNPPGAATQVYSAMGVIEAIQPDGKTAVIQHSAISNYMPAMTMTFRAKDSSELRGLQAGDSIAFHLVVTRDDGWI